MDNDLLLGELTVEEEVEYFGKLMDNRAAIMREQAAKIAKLTKALDELCYNAEPVCECLEMGQVLQTPKTLRSFRAALDSGWAMVLAELRAHN